MGRMKVRGNAAAVAKAAKTDPGTFKEYDGEAPPRGVYRLKLRPGMETKVNSAGDPWISMLAVIDEPAKKGRLNNPKAKYNGALVRASENMSLERPQFFNGMLASFGITDKAQLNTIWTKGFLTTERPGKNDLVASFGKRTVEAICGDYFFAKVDTVPGGINKQSKKKYPDRLEVVSWLTVNDIVSSPVEPDEDADDDQEESDEESEESEEDEEPDEEEEDEEGEDEDDEDDAREEREAELGGLKRPELRKLAKEIDSAFKITTSVTDQDIIDFILDEEFPEEEGDEEDEEEPEDDEADEEGDEEEPDELDDLDRKGLKAYIKANDVEFTVKTSHTDEDIREAIREALAEEPEDEPEPPKPVAKGKGARRAKGGGEPPF